MNIDGWKIFNPKKMLNSSILIKKTRYDDFQWVIMTCKDSCQQRTTYDHQWVAEPLHICSNRVHTDTYAASDTERIRRKRKLLREERERNETS